jgi:subtilisin family serine protease
LPATAPRTTSAQRLELTSEASQAYLAHLQRQQVAFEAALKQAVPQATVQRRYQVVFNGLAVRAPEADLTKIRRLPGVRAVTPDRPYHLALDHSVPLIGAPQLWKQFGGPMEAGRGVKVAVIDTGIYISNTFFSPEGFTYPGGFPKGEAEYTTPKVIAARAYFRPDDPPAPGHGTPLPGPTLWGEYSHGTHVSGIAAGVPTTVTLPGTVGERIGITHTLAGVAPGAWLMNYKIFYQSQNLSQSGVAFTAEILAAIEDAVADGADVISNSWGGDIAAASWTDPIVQAVEAAVDAGVVMVFAAANDGPYHGTISSPAVSPRVISVGASTAPLTFTFPAGTVDVTAPTPVISDVVGAHWLDSPGLGPPITQTIGPLPYAWAGAVATDGSPEGCNLDGAPNPFPHGSLAGQIALIQRGTCAAKDKVRNAQAAGAAAVVIYERQPGPALFSTCSGDCDDVVIPAVSIEQAPGEAMAAWYRDHPETAQMRIGYATEVTRIPPDAVAQFSSRGPTADLRLKPDVVAPGVYVLSAGYGGPPGDPGNHFAGFGLASGTSMATPHVAGAAALLRQLHPAWTPDQIKSALMSTAKVEGFSPESSGATSTILDFGAGRIDLARAGAPGLTLDPPSLSLLTRQGRYARRSIVVTGAGEAQETYAVTTSRVGTTTAGVVLQPEPAQLTVAPGERLNLTLNVGVAPDAPPGDYEGLVWLRGETHTAHIPYWVRVLPARQTDVLLLDNDGSSNLTLPDPLPDYAGYYTRTLESLGLSYAYFDADAARLSEALSLGDLLRYRTVLWFTGDSATRGPHGLSEADQARLMDYLNSGGRLLATGQNLAAASALESGPGRTLLYRGYMGAEYLQDSLFSGPSPALPPQPSVTASGPNSFLGNLRLDLGLPVTTTAGAGAGNQFSVDEIAVSQASDALALGYADARPLFTALGGQPEEAGTVGLAVSAEPSLEEPRQALRYRTVYLAFGLEGINDNTGYATRAEVTRKLLNWLADEVTVELAGPFVQGSQGAGEPGSGGAEERRSRGAEEPFGQAQDRQRRATVGAPAVFSGTVTSSIPGTRFTRFRWDFGDGAPVQTTFRPSVFHVYQSPGRYTVRLEATDSYGHRGMATTEVAVQPAEKRIYLSFVGRE